MKSVPLHRFAPTSLPAALRPVSGLAALCGLALGAFPGTSAAQVFTKITSGHPVTESGGYRASNWIDVDGDGDLDLYVTTGGVLGENNELYRNDGGGTFAFLATAAVSQEGLRDVGSSWGDYDGDGDADLFTVSWYGEDNALFENLGGGSFTRVTTGAIVNTGTHSEDCAFADYDNDGDLDVFLANSGAGGNAPNFLYRNDGGGSFEPIAAGPVVTDARTSRHGAWADWDDDGDVDLFVANESNQTNDLYRNLLVETGTASFESVAMGELTTGLTQSWSASWGDWDNDGDLDLVVGNFGGTKNRLYRNDLVETGTATLTRIEGMDPAENRGWTASTTWADFDNDADLDLLLTNGFAPNQTTTRKNFLYRNDAGTLFRVMDGVVSADSGWSYGAAWADHDEDGDLDLHVANWYGNDQESYLYRNEAQDLGNHWLTIRCVGTISNTSGIGARIRVHAVVSGSPVLQVREISGSDGYCSQNLVAHFGLGDAASADSIVVRWPSGIVQILAAEPADRHLVIVEPGASDAGWLPAGGPGGSRLWRAAAPNPFRSSTRLSFELPSPADVDVTIFDAAGRRVARVARGRRERGPHALSWSGLDSGGLPVPAGVYFARIVARGAGEGAARGEGMPILRLR